jgi:hypothetical protein
MTTKHYPSWRYHRSLAARLVLNASEDAALGDEWAHNPAEFEPKAPASGDSDGPDADKPLEELTAKELRALAEARGLDLPGNASKAKLIEALQGGGNS